MCYEEYVCNFINKNNNNCFAYLWKNVPDFIQKNVLNIIIEWPGLESKIIILVGHGLLNLIQGKSNVYFITYKF